VISLYVTKLDALAADLNARIATINENTTILAETAGLECVDPAPAARTKAQNRPKRSKVVRRAAA
jgi:Lhr-like helicase